MSGIRKALTLVLAAAVISGTAAPAMPAGTVAVARLAPESAAFWNGDSPLTPDSTPLPDCAGCTDFAIELTTHAERLRVALDTTGNDGSFSLELYDAEGVALAYTSGPYSMEAYVDQPSPGFYFARATGGRAEGFRMRAKLERNVPEPPPSAGALLPNLQLIPPYEFTFYSLIDSPVAGRDATSCNVYEQVEYAAKRCLRFSLGPKNLGPGPLMLRFDGDPVAGVVERGQVTQLIRHANGDESERPGGSSVYHKTHGHYHHNGFGTLELLRVLDPTTGHMVPAGSGPKQGFCMLDFMIADWTAFANEPEGSVRQDCGVVEGPSGVQLGLGAGWGDIYTYGLDGNYVEFGENTDGLFVVRSIADAFDDVLETDETDNAGYAYIRVEGNGVEVLERGHGSSPWDPGKRLATDILPSNP